MDRPSNENEKLNVVSIAHDTPSQNQVSIPLFCVAVPCQHYWFVIVIFISQPAVLNQQWEVTKGGAYYYTLLDDIGIEDHVCTINIEIYLVTRVHSISLKTRLMDHHHHDPRKAMYLSLVVAFNKERHLRKIPTPTLDINIDLSPFPRSMIHSFWDYINIIIIHYTSRPRPLQEVVAQSSLFRYRFLHKMFTMMMGHAKLLPNSLILIYQRLFSIFYSAIKVRFQWAEIWSIMGAWIIFYTTTVETLATIPLTNRPFGTFITHILLACIIMID